MSKYLDSRTIDKLEVAADSLRLHIAATDVRLEAYSADSVRFAALRDSFRLVSSSLRADLKSARGRTRLVIESRDSARATIRIDTLTPQLGADRRADWARSLFGRGSDFLMNKQQTKQINGQVVLDNESGNRFYHRALARKARLKKKAKRRQRQRSQCRNRGKR